jgi:alkylated DNA repair dioxygenase AlkB
MAIALVGQPSLFGCGDPGFDPTLSGIRRLPLSRGAWVDHLPAWVVGHQALFDALWSTTRWRSERRWMYEREVDVPRLFAVLPDDGPGHPLLPELGAALSSHYHRQLPEISLAAYRDGRDSVAFHGDRLGRLRADAVVAIVSLGEPRRFLLRPMGGGASHGFDLGWGDLLVMGGTCQRTWQHGIPKVASAGPRISVQFRPDVSDERGAGRRRGQAVEWKRNLAPAAGTRPAPGHAPGAGSPSRLSLGARADELPHAPPGVG